jgi:uncharacterized protein DUF6874
MYADLSPADATLITDIARRAVKFAKANGQKVNFVDVMMDLMAAHKCNPLRLRDLFNADDFNFAHDVFGIARHLNRKTGCLEDHFSPRFTDREAMKKMVQR